MKQMKQKHFFAAFIFFCALTAAHSDERDALIFNMEGEVYIKQSPSSSWMAAEKNTHIPKGSIIATGVKSFVELKITESDGWVSLITINSLSKYMVGEDAQEDDLVSVNRILIPPPPIGFGINTRLKLLPGDDDSIEREPASMDASRTSDYDFRKAQIPRRGSINVILSWPKNKS
jgi:hypothetical protein